VPHIWDIIIAVFGLILIISGAIMPPKPAMDPWPESGAYKRNRRSLEEYNKDVEGHIWRIVFGVIVVIAAVVLWFI
jgi:hypothetical protein